MSNRTFLFRSDFPDISPDRAENSAFDDTAHVVAAGANQVPLLWLGLFRSTDLRTSVLKNEENDDDVTEEAPLTEAARGLAQLDAALPLLGSLFPELTTLSADADRLRQAIRSFSGRYLTMDCSELEAMGASPPFLDTLRRQLAFLSAPDTEVAPMDTRWFERFRRPRTQLQLRRELLAAHSTLADPNRKGFVPDLIGESWLREWPDEH